MEFIFPTRNLISLILLSEISAIYVPFKAYENVVSSSMIMLTEESELN